jgi:hypothetical protein
MAPKRKKRRVKEADGSAAKKRRAGDDKAPAAPAEKTQASPSSSSSAAAVAAVSDAKSEKKSKTLAWKEFMGKSAKRADEIERIFQASKLDNKPPPGEESLLVLCMTIIHESLMYESPAPKGTNPSFRITITEELAKKETNTSLAIGINYKGNEELCDWLEKDLARHGSWLWGTSSATVTLKAARFIPAYLFALSDDGILKVPFDVLGCMCMCIHQARPLADIRQEWKELSVKSWGKGMKFDEMVSLVQALLIPRGRSCVTLEHKSPDVLEKELGKALVSVLREEMLG